MDITDHLTKCGIDYKPYSRGLIASCPFAQWTHEKGSDRHRSFVIWPEIDRYQCYACGVKGNLFDLFKSLHQYSQSPETAAVLAGWDEDLYRLQLLLRKPPKVRRRREYFDEEMLLGFPSYKGTPAETYLDHRGLLHSADRFDLRYDTVSNRAVCPVRDKKGLLGMVGRAIDPNDPHKHFKYFFQSANCLGGEHLFTENKKLILVEGYTDMLRVYPWAQSLGFDVGCTWTANISHKQVDIIASTGKVPYCCFDQDQAGEKGFKELERLYPSNVMFRYYWSYRNSKGDLKDLGEFTEQDFYESFTQ